MNSIALNTSIANIDSSTWILTLSSVNLFLEQKVYVFKFKAWVTDNAAGAVQSTLTITVSYCKMATIAVPLSLKDMYFDVLATKNTTMTFSRWNNSYESRCGSFYPLTATFSNSSTS